MRIGMFADSYRPYMSGVTNSVVLYKEYLESLGHEVFVFTYGHTRMAKEHNVLRSPGFGWLATGYQLGYPISAEAKRIAATLDVAHVHQPFLSGLKAWRLSDSQRRFPIVFTCHSRYLDQAREYGKAIPAPLRQRYVRRYLEWFTQRVSAVIVPSTSNREWLEGVGITERVVVLPNAIDTAPFESAAASRPRWREGEGEFRYCYSGRLAPEKNLDVVLAAFAAVRARSSARLTFIGDGSERRELERGVEEMGLSGSVDFLGEVSYERMPAVLAQQHCFVTASLTEALPLSLIEASAAGLPIVAGDGPGMRDVVVAERTGILTEPRPEALASAMLRVRDPGVWEGMSAAAIERGREFSIECVGKRMLDLYDRVRTRRP